MARTKKENLNDSKFINPEHLRKIEVGNLEVENARLVMLVEEQQLQSMYMKQELLVSNIEKQRAVLKSKSSEYNSIKNKMEGYKKEIWPVYGLTESEPLAYDSQTGEIKKP